MCTLVQTARGFRLDGDGTMVATESTQPPRAYCPLDTRTASANRLADSTTSLRSRPASDGGASVLPAPTVRAPAANQSGTLSTEIPPVGTKETSGNGPRSAFR